MKIERLRPELAEDYDRFLPGAGGSLFYHSSKYKEFLKALLGCGEEYLVATEGGRLVGALPLMYAEAGGARVYNSLPYYGSNGGVLTQDARAREGLVGAYNEIASRSGTLASTVVGSPFDARSAEGVVFTHTDYRVGQFTDISGCDGRRERVMERIDASARRNVKKAEREGVTVGVEHAEMGGLRRMHQANMAEIGGSAKADEFFALVPAHFAAGEDYDLYVARRDGSVVAALLVFYFNRTVEYFTPATDAGHREVQPLSLILVEAMAEASRRGFLRWNWGGTWATQTGVYRFKKKWGAQERNYHYFTQLNDRSVLGWTPARATATYPGFFVVPFSALEGQAGAGA